MASSTTTPAIVQAAPAAEVSAAASIASHGDVDASKSGGSSSHHSDDEKTADEEQGKAAAAAAPGADSDIQGPEILSRRKFLPLYVGMLLSVAIISLDQTIVATAQVPIVEALGGASLITWLPTTFLIGQCSFSLLFGQLLTIFPSKHVYLGAILLFELGSLVSALAHNMGAMLAGRTVSGVGAAGIFMGVLQVMVETTTLAKRATYTGLLGSLFSISMVIGPLIGGSLSDKVTWRWCFYINLPIGGVTVLTVLLLFNTRPALGSSKSGANRASLLTRLIALDWLSVVLLTGLVCMIIVPMQLAQQNGWTSAATLAPICLSPVVLAITYGWFVYRERGNTDPTNVRTIVPLSVVRNGCLMACSVASAIIFWIAIEFIYLIPLFYETVLGHSALKSGVDMLGFVITFGVFATVGGALSRITGHYYPQFLVCPLLGIVASGLIFATKISSSTGYHVGTQILLGLALGPMIQSPMLALQANCPDKRLIARAMSFMAFFQRFGGGVGASLTGAVLSAQLPIQIRNHLRAISVDPTPYVKISYNDIYRLPQGPVRDALLRALTSVLNDISLAGIPLFAIVFVLVVFFIPACNIKTSKIVTKREAVVRLFGVRGRGKTEEQQQQSAEEA